MNQATINFTPQRSGHIHAAKLDNWRLQRMLTLLKSGKRYTTLDVTRATKILAVGTVASELRANGIDVQCKCIGRGRFEYWLEES